MNYFLDGKEVCPVHISSCSFQLNEVESSDGYNFEVDTLNLRVQIGSSDIPCKANFLIKVVPEITSNDKLPEEKVIGIRNNRITLRK